MIVGNLGSRCVRTIALDAVFVDGESLVAATGKAADAVLAASVIAHVGKLGALVDVFAIDVAVTLGAEFFESSRPGFGTRIAAETPGFADGAAADALQIVTVQIFGTDSVAVVQIAGFLALVDAACPRVIQGQSWWTRAGE